MGATSVSRRRARSRTRDRARRHRRRAPTPAETAWIAALPCALLTLARARALGPALGHLLLRPRAHVFWPSIARRPAAGAARALPRRAARPAAARRRSCCAQPRSPRRGCRPRASRAIRRSCSPAQAARRVVLVSLRRAERHRPQRRLPAGDARVYFRWRTLLVALRAAGARARAAASRRARRDRCARCRARRPRGTPSAPRARGALHAAVAD